MGDLMERQDDHLPSSVSIKCPGCGKDSSIRLMNRRETTLCFECVFQQVVFRWGKRGSVRFGIESRPYKTSVNLSAMKQIILGSSADPCVYCGGKAESVDHIRPKSDGGDSTVRNLAPACLSCNHAKGSKSILLFLVGKVHL